MKVGQVVRVRRVRLVGQKLYKMKLSIITINYNNAEGLRKTMESVLAQTYTEIEYIIVDGASTDGSVDVIRELATRPTIKWVSEKDTGIYNAMNKGLEIALGKRVVNDDHTSQPILNPSLNEPTPNPFLKEGEHASFAKTWGAHTADSTQYDLLKENAVSNRKNPTEAESVLWDLLKGNKIGCHFRRQHIILDYIVDFICLDKGLIIELDGGYHNDPQQMEYDKARTAHLQRLGYTELRFKNEELLCNPDAVIQKITDALEALPSISSLPFREGPGVGPTLPSLQGGVGGRLASDYIQILNSGDILAADDVTARMFQAMGNGQWAIDNETNRQSPIANHPQIPIFYGNMIKEYPDGRRVVDRCQAKDYTPESFYYFYRGTLNHDCAYIRRDLFEKYGLYNEEMKICSDWEWYVRAIVLGGEKTVYTNIDVTVFDMTGISESDGKSRDTILKERREYLESILPAAVLRDYDMFSLPIEQYRRLKKYNLWGVVYFVERVLFKFEKWGNKLKRKKKEP